MSTNNCYVPVLKDIEKLFKAYIDIQFRFYAYVVGYCYLAFMYLLSPIIPPLKKVINNFDNGGIKNSTAIISLISGSILFLLFVYIVKLDPDFNISLLGMFGMYIGYFIWGYFALFLLADYRLKAKKNKEVTYRDRDAHH